MATKVSPKLLTYSFLVLRLSSTDDNKIFFGGGLG